MIEERTADSYRVRTLVGVVTVPIETVDRVEERESLLEQYERRAKSADDTAAAQLALADWCRENGLKAERRVHLERALKADPHSVEVRAALGFVRVGPNWVDVRSADKPASRKAERAAPDAPEADTEKLVAAIQAHWGLRIRAIRDNLLETSLARLVRDGRRRIAEINDPLAILPLTRTLSEGGRQSRLALLEALSRFEHDEATMNLAVVALADPDEEIRTEAVTELVRRGDPRVAAQFREALGSDNDELIRRAAVALGRLQAGSAVPELIELLTARRRKATEVATNDFFTSYSQRFDQSADVSLGGLRVTNYRPQIGVAYVFNSNFAFPRMEWRVGNVTVFRTEVLEALKQITGKNFGFEAEAWRRWYEESKP